MLHTHGQQAALAQTYGIDSLKRKPALLEKQSQNQDRNSAVYNCLENLTSAYADSQIDSSLSCNGRPRRGGLP